LEYILEIKSSQSFEMIGGILKYGISNISTSTKLSSNFPSNSSSSKSLSSTYSSSLSPWSFFFNDNSFHFICVNDNGYLLMSEMKLIFEGKMKSMIYIRGGIVCMEYVKVNNEEWVEPLIEVYKIISRIIIEMYKNIIKNCNYHYECINSACIYKSAIIFIDKMNEENENLNINIWNCVFNNNIINLFYDDSGNGNLFHFLSKNKTSSIIYYYLFECYFFFFNLLVFSITDCIFVDIVGYASRGGLNYLFIFT
jgi:hypothetical protein